MPFCANFAKIYPKKVHIAVNKSHEGINKQKFKYRRVVFGEKTLAATLTWLLGKSWLIEYKWHEERGLILKIKVTSGYFCGQEMLSYVVNTKISHKFDFRNFRFFWFPWGSYHLKQHWDWIHKLWSMSYGYDLYVIHVLYRNNRRHIFPEFYLWEFFWLWLHPPYLTNLPDCLNIFYEILHYAWLILFNKIVWRVLRIQVGLVCFLLNKIQNVNIIQKHFSWWSPLICSLPDIYGAADNSAPLG